MAIKWNSPSRKGAQSMPPSKQEIGRRHFCLDDTEKISKICRKFIGTKLIFLQLKLTQGGPIMLC